MPGSSDSTSEVSARRFVHRSTPSRSSSERRQSIIPATSLRQLDAEASRSCPPGFAAASRTLTECPLSASIRAASSPAGPAPTTTARVVPDGFRETSWGQCRSLAAAGLCAQVGRLSPMQWVIPTHGRIRSSSPRRILLTICGSAMWARVMTTMSSSPSRMACRAVARSTIRAAWNTGRFTACLNRPAISSQGAAGEPIAGMQSVMSRSSVSIRP